MLRAGGRGALGIKDTGISKVTVTLNSGKTYTARIVGTDTADDLAVIHINASGLTPAASP